MVDCSCEVDSKIMIFIECRNIINCVFKMWLDAFKFSPKLIVHSIKTISSSFSHIIYIINNNFNNDKEHKQNQKTF